VSVTDKEVIRTDGAPAPFQGAPYSQAVRFGDLLYVAGQVALAPGADALTGDTIEEQTEQACENVKTILEAAGSSFERVLNTTIYLTDFADFAGLNEVYGRYVGERPPARATVQVAALPMGAKVEIAVVAHV
jgi:2-iminobutanoate/2-iminopropanoate deaminase